MQHDTGQQCIVVLAFIRDAGGRILVHRRRDPYTANADGKWDVPGGEIDFGEKPEGALVRECQEEIGCTIAVLRLLPWVRSHVWDRNDGSRLQVFALGYECRITSGMPRPASSAEVTAVQWQTPAEIATLDTLPGIKEFVQLLAAE